ncbi:Mini-ribonuclease 3 [Marinicrinis lubricantis]|uniref:Mini-ribonuclease 3 n=1 Tax=Marinicrinis lubricantis TaxID=2086470 RepID=A0ABW1IS74_9BACL
MEHQLEMMGRLFEPSKRPELLHPLVLAYIGDGVYEVFVRQHLLSRKNHKPHHLQKEAVKYVSAKAQAKALEKLMPSLTEPEQEFVRRGRNAKSGTIPKNASVAEYRHSTAFECLIGYLYCTKQYSRLQDIILRVIQEED